MEKNRFSLAIFTENEPHFVLPVVARICKELEGSASIAALIVTEKFGNRSFGENVKRFYPLLRMKGLLLTLLDEALLTVRNAFRMHGAHTLSSISRQFEIPILTTADVNSSDLEAKLKSLNVDLFVSISFGQIIKNHIIKIPRKGMINLHSSLLPQYRGLMPNFWVLVNGERETGITVHYIDAGIDTGRIIEQARFSIPPGASYYELLQISKKIGSATIVNVIRKMIEGREIPAVQPDAEGSYYGFPRKQDFTAFWERGLRYR